MAEENTSSSRCQEPHIEYDMDPSYVSLDDDDPDGMARFMGFSTFGKATAKKRKFNPSTDAVIEGQELAALDKGGKRGQGSGGNDVPLGRARELGVPSADAGTKNDDEMELLDDEDLGEEGGASFTGPGGVPVGAEEDGPSYIDTSRAPPNEEAKAVQERIDAIITGAPLTPNNNMLEDMIRTSLPGRGIGEFVSASSDTAHIHPSSVGQGFAAAAAAAAVAPTPPEASRPRERPQRNELWYVGYYDPSFNENPWARLEIQKGIQSRGTWVERDQRRS
ncbi:MAG: hypothetical protein M1818_000723 [Claussenomyces sp. TS43310]|nr:MAG: hypothetical protein M1818_000723 [Claussenomyces sp. TS43310]